MANEVVFTHVDSDLRSVLEELGGREPIFHTKRFGRNLEDFERGTAPDFWEVGASGRRYSREFILNMRSRDALVNADDAGWRASGFGIRRLGPDCFLVTYTLDQTGRISRRATIWECAAGGWRLVYHQGTPVTGDGSDDSLPAQVPGSKEA